MRLSCDSDDASALCETLNQIACRQGIRQPAGRGDSRSRPANWWNRAGFRSACEGAEIPGYRAMRLADDGPGIRRRLTSGADHNRSAPTKADFSTMADHLLPVPMGRLLAIETEDRSALIDSLILCKFLRGVFTDLYEESAELLAATTGWQRHWPANFVILRNASSPPRNSTTSAKDGRPPKTRCPRGCCPRAAAGNRSRRIVARREIADHGASLLSRTRLDGGRASARAIDATALQLGDWLVEKSGDDS